MRRPSLWIACLVLLASCGACTASEGIRGTPMRRLGRSLQAVPDVFHLPTAVQGAALLGAYDAHALIPIVVSLQTGASPDDFLESLEDPSSPNFQQYITPKEFAAKFGASQASLKAVSNFLSSSGMTDISVSASGLTVTATATAKQAGDAFKTSLASYQGPSGPVFYSPSVQPSIPESLQGIVLSIDGLDNYPIASSSYRLLDASLASASQRGSGPGGGMTPADIAKAYDIPAANYTGAGQVNAIATLATYTAKDANFYASYYGLGSLNLTNVYIGAVPTSFDPNGVETTLDIAMQSAVSPRAHILVYQALNTKAGYKSLMGKIADDNKAPVISFSWGSDEQDTSFDYAVHQVFQQMAAQGQSFFVSTGDTGCLGIFNTVAVQSPANDPSVCAVGGTGFTGKGAYSQKFQTAWSGSGGGISQVWKAPSFQSAVTQSTMRQVPDVALNSDPNTGYSLFFTAIKGPMQAYIAGGTSAAAPLWASFTGLVNECRARKGKGRVGPIPPKLYPLVVNSTLYKAVMDDITSGDNTCYKGRKGYDAVTGLGTFNGAPLLNYLCSV